MIIYNAGLRTYNSGKVLIITFSFLQSHGPVNKEILSEATNYMDKEETRKFVEYHKNMTKNIIERIFSQ